MFMEAGIDGAFTNHILWATAATDLFQTGVPEKVIQESTGHCSVKALWQYERVAVTQPAASNILNGTSLQDHDMNKCSNSQPTPNNIATLPFQMPSFSPLLNNNSKGNTNFTVNICPSGNIV